jgi:ABC-2 type transport system permease protein
MLPIIFALPIVQMLILVYAATQDIKNIEMVVMDKDMTTTSRGLISKFDGSPFFILETGSFSMAKAESYLYKNQADLIIHIPAGFERKLAREGESDVQFLVNAINGTKASLVNAYTINIVADYNKSILGQWTGMPAEKMDNRIDVRPSYWYNPELNYKFYMLPGILVVLVTVVGMFLTALNIVREKEMGTIEQINVTPIKKYQFILGKMIPFWCIALFELGFGLLVGKMLFNIPMEGSLLLLFGFTAVYLFLILGLGLFMSTMAQTQQQVMFFSYFFMLTFILMSGIFTPEESMPNWAQQVNIINPIAYFMRAIRMILLKGSGFLDVLPEMASLALYGGIVLILAVWRYRKVA